MDQNRDPSLLCRRCSVRCVCVCVCTCPRVCAYAHHCNRQSGSESVHCRMCSCTFRSSSLGTKNSWEMAHWEELPDHTEHKGIF